MGVVYEAEQVSLGQVALKVLSTGRTRSPQEIERFLREARSAAQLHHTNIVPVFGVGEDEEVSFYAMQLIEGHGLDKVLDEVIRQKGGRPPSASTARRRPLVRPRAVPHAFAPLGDEAPSGRRGPSDSQPDIGEPPATSIAVAPDRTGAIPGASHRSACRWPKPSIMGGQVSLGRRVARVASGAAADRTGARSPQEIGRGCDSHRLRDHPRDDAPAEVVLPGVPRDLETIVHKAIEKDPADRYPTAGAVAEDLRCFLFTSGRRSSRPRSTQVYTGPNRRREETRRRPHAGRHVAQADPPAWQASFEEDYRRPVQLAESSVASRTESNRLNTLGAILYRGGEFSAAVEQLERSVAIHGAGGTAYDAVFLAMAHHRLGHPAKAREWLRRTGMPASAGMHKPDESGPSSWIPRLELELLRREANALLDPPAS